MVSQTPPPASFPVLPPVKNLPIVDVTDAYGMATGSVGVPNSHFHQWCQSIWASIQGGGGVIGSADAAQAAADAAQASADTAQTDASAAQTSADSAQTSADTAQATATNAQTTADAAQVAAANAQATADAALVTRLDGPFTVATLPVAPVTGKTAYVTDATAPTYLGVLAGGGLVVTPVFFDGTIWRSF